MDERKRKKKNRGKKKGPARPDLVVKKRQPRKRTLAGSIWIVPAATYYRGD